LRCKSQKLSKYVNNFTQNIDNDVKRLDNQGRPQDDASPGIGEEPLASPEGIRPDGGELNPAGDKSPQAPDDRRGESPDDKKQGQIPEVPQKPRDYPGQIGRNQDGDAIIVDKNGKTFQSDPIVTGVANTYEELANKIVQVPKKPVLDYGKYDKTPSDIEGQAPGTPGDGRGQSPRQPDVSNIQRGDQGQPGNKRPGQKPPPIRTVRTPDLFDGLRDDQADGVRRPGRPDRADKPDQRDKDGGRPPRSSDQESPIREDLPVRRQELGAQDNLSLVVWMQ
jgi:hypothetical protein